MAPSFTLRYNFLFWSPLIVLAVACDTRSRGQPPDSPKPATAAVPRPTQPPSETGTYLGYANRDCPADTVAVHTDPAQLVREYSQRDTAGRTDDWDNGAVVCKGFLYSDDVDVVVGYTQLQLPLVGDTARFTIDYARRLTLAYTDGATRYHLVPARGRVVDTVTVVRGSKGWRIMAINATKHFSPSTARRALDCLHATDFAELSALESRQTPEQTRRGHELPEHCRPPNHDLNHDL